MDELNSGMENVDDNRDVVRSAKAEWKVCSRVEFGLLAVSIIVLSIIVDSIVVENVVCGVREDSSPIREDSLGSEAVVSFSDELIKVVSFRGACKVITMITKL